MAAPATATATTTAPAAASAAPTAAAKPSGRVALVTGANKGIGYAIVQRMASDYKDVTILLGARDQKKGEQAVKALGKSNVQLLVVDVDDEKSIKAAAETVKSKFGGVDILINNAGIAWKGDAFDENVATTTLRTNYYGVLHMFDSFMPLMRDNGRVVTVSSSVGARTLKNIAAPLQAAFIDPKLTVPKLTALVEQFKTAVKNNTWQADGWPKSTYGVSKAAVSMHTRIMARDNPRKDVLINCCCPGWVRTDMSGPKADKSPEEGAETPVFLSFLPGGPNAQTGLYWREKKVLPWVAQ